MFVLVDMANNRIIRIKIVNIFLEIDSKFMLTFPAFCLYMYSQSFV